MPKNDSTAVLEKNSKTQNEIIYVGVDDGHAEIKVVTSTGLKFQMPSKAVEGRKVLSLGTNALGFSIVGTEVEGNIRHFTISKDLQNILETRERNYPISDLNLVLVHAALGNSGLGRELGEGSQKVKICTGLPISTAYLPSGDPNSKIIEGKKRNLVRKVVVDGYEPCEIVSNSVVSEGIAALIDLMIDDHGKPTEFGNECADSLNMVIDIGGKTTDFGVLLPGGTALDSSRFGSIDLGMMHLADEVADRVRRELDLDSDFKGSHYSIPKLIRTGEFTWAGKQMDFNPLVSEVRKIIGQSIKEKIESKCRTADINKIIFVGGGAEFFRTFFEESYPGQAVFPSDPQFANARGMLKFIQFFAR